jgi:hypothetical protein
MITNNQKKNNCICEVPFESTLFSLAIPMSQTSIKDLRNKQTKKQSKGK